MSSLNDWKVWILNDPRFGATNVLSNFIFSSYLLVYPEVVMCLAYTSKKCEFWGPHLRGTPIVVLPNFVKFYLFIFAYSENFISPGCVVQFWILASLFEGDPFILLPPNFVCISDAVTSRQVLTLMTPITSIMFLVLSTQYTRKSSLQKKTKRTMNWPSWMSKSQKFGLHLNINISKKYQPRHLHKMGQLCSESIQTKLGLDVTAPGI